MLDLSARKVYGALAEQCVGGDAKADKVENATSGNLAGLDSNGNLTDSGVSPTEEVTVEGNPVTFDSPFEQDAKSVVVSVKPIQDLHGYNHPWPAGGGKNKLPLTVANLKASNTTGTWNGNVYSIANGTIEILTDDGGNVTGIKANGTFNEQVLFYINGSVENQQSIIFNGVEDGSVSTYSINMLINGTFAGDVYDGDSSIHTIPASADYSYLIVLRSGYNASNLMFYPMVRDSSVSDPTFAPYSNICPISGIDEVEIEVSGKNQVKAVYKGYPNTASKTFTIDNDSESAIFYAQAGQIYTTSAGTTLNRSLIAYAGTDNIVGGMSISNITNLGDNTRTWTATWTGWTIWYVYAASSAEVESSLQIELGSTPTAYEPYKGHTTTIPLPSTLYDADVDVTNGDADSRYGYIASYNGETLPGAWISDRDEYTGSNSPTTGAEVCYELATPTTLSFDPTDVELLEGANVVSTNGEKVAVTYGRSLWQDIDELKTDTEGKLNKSDVATIEGDTASKTYSVNDFMLRSDGFYKVTQPIAQNASITASNTTKTTVGEVLTALLNA